MSLSAMELAAQIAVERVLNSLPEGLLIAVCAWALLRVIRRQNAGTRFAVWMVALVGVAVLPWIRGLDAAAASSGTSAGTALAIPAAWALAIFLLWLLASCMLLARLAAGAWQMKRTRRDCLELPASDLSPTLQELIRRSRRRVRILVSADARVPSATGLWKPAIVLPAWALAELSAEDLQAIVVHELTHLQRRDDWTNLLQKAVRAVLFFHPAVWWIESRLSMEREMACDDAVLAATGNPHAYAGCLIGLLERNCARRGWTVAQAAVARACDAALRIARILDPRRPGSIRVGRMAPAAAAALSAACIAIAICAPRFVAVTPPPPDTVAAVASAPAPRSSADHPRGRVVPAAFAVPETGRRHHRHAVQPLRRARTVSAVLTRNRPFSPRADSVSLQVISTPSVQRVLAPNWTVYEAALYSRTTSAKSLAGTPAIIQTFAFQTVSYREDGISIQRTSMVQVVWMIPAQVIAEEQSFSKSV